MRKALLILTSALTFISMGYSSELKGKDYISMQVGTVYAYKSIDEGAKTKFLINTTIKSCNKDKNLCQYVSELKDSSGSEIPGSKYEYAYKVKEDGSVYTVSPVSKKENKLFPADIKLGKVEKKHQSTASRDTTSSLEFKKTIPEITITGKSYKNCIELDANSIIKLKNQVIKTESKEFYCKDVGLVKENIKETLNSEKPIVYENTLTSISVQDEKS